MVHTIRLQRRWPLRRLRHHGYVKLFFDLRGNRGWREERAVWITYEDGRLQAELVNYAADPPQVMHRIPLWRTNGRTIKVAFRKSALRRRDFAYYDWIALSFVEERHPLCGRRGGCSDYAPDRGYIRHRL